MRFTSMLRVVAVHLMLSMLAASSSANEINTCKYLLITDFTSDPFGIAKELRSQGNEELWRARRDSNSRPIAPEAIALSS